MIKKYGFTLVELVIVIVILGILATIALPKFVDLKNKASIASEAAAIGALRSAVSIQHSKNVLDGTKNLNDNYWPAENPFTLLSQAPPNKAWDATPSDGITWKTFDDSPHYAWYIMCPHYEGNQYGGSGMSKGRFYVYQYCIDWGHQSGEIWLEYSAGE